MAAYGPFRMPVAPSNYQPQQRTMQFKAETEGENEFKGKTMKTDYTANNQAGTCTSKSALSEL